ncbi:hypothetical protein LPJ38_23895 [Bradyrhizobium daqingense]|uniref:hypothetical protein n=1 Tax=Bradyrhizobium daqingense TaxID=993502 RepID=UPI001E599D32|nr:hypothetical protein [Bradyrhizobium daqingense]UFS86703.1 hypothetical protein LPJ38_23895 [Bradyrhizobium daqingense]
MEQRETISEEQSGVALPTLPPWMRPAAPYAPDRRARMLEHMARTRTQPQAIAAQPPAQSSRAAVMAILGDAFGYAVLFAIIALLFQSRVPLYVGAFVFLADGPRIESALGAIGIRFEPDTIGPDIIKSSVFWFGWIALLVSIRDAVPAWLAMDAPDLVMVGHRRHRRRARHFRCTCSLGAPAHKTVVRIDDQPGRPDLDDGQVRHRRRRPGAAGAARGGLKAAVRLAMTTL